MFACKSSGQWPKLDDGEGHRDKAGIGNPDSLLHFLACCRALGLRGYSFPMKVVLHSLEALFFLLP